MENFQFRNTDLNNIEVGCTKGSVKKYLAALHANVNESNGSVSNEEKFLDNKVLVFDPPIGLEDYLEKLAPILMSMDILWFDGQPLKKGREIGKNVYQRNSTFKYFLFDRKDPDKTYFTQHNWVMSALPNDKELEKYQKGGNETAQQFNNSEKIDGWGFVNNFKDIIGFDPFNQLNESEEEFDWVPKIENGVSIPFGEIFNSDILSLGDVIEISGSITDGNPDKERIYVTFNKTPLRLHDVNKHSIEDPRGGKSMSFEWLQPIESRPSGWNVVSTSGYFETDSSTMKTDGHLIVSTIIKSDINESEDLEWAQDITSNSSVIDGLLSFKGKEIVIDVSDLDSDQMVQLYDVLSPYVKVEGYDGPDIWWDNGCFRREIFRTSTAQVISLHCGIVDGLVCCLDSLDEALRTLEEGDYIQIDGKMLLSENINESEEEFDWVPREVDLNNPEVLFTVIDNVLKNTNFKIVKSTNPFSIGGVTYHIEDEYGDTYIYINEQDFNLPFIYHDIRDNLSFLTAEEDNELIPYYKKLLRLIQPLYNNNKDILFKPINESEFDDLEWAEDAISGLDHYEEWDGKTELNDDTFLMINGEWDGLDFHNQPAKIVRVSDPEEHSYLLAFPQVIDAYEQNTHCGNIEDFLDDEYKCHCEDTDSQRGRCWYVPLGELSEVKIFPNRKGFLGESEDLEWAEELNPTYKFGDLVFKPHHIPGAVRARLNFPNGHYISVVGGPHLYGDGVDTFEIWGSDADEPEGYLSKAEVTDRMLELQELPPLEGEGSFKKGPVTESEEEEEFDWIKDIEGNEYWVNFDQISKGDYVMYKMGAAIQEPKDGGFWQVVRFRECLTYNPMDWSTVKMPCVDLQSVKDAKGQRWLTGENITVTNKPEEFRSYPIKFRILDKVDWLRNRGWRVPLKGNWHLNDLNLKLDESENKKSLLTEGRYDTITRQAVKDIMNVVIQTRGRNDELHQAVLPNAMREDEFEYSQEGLSFSIELNVHHQNIYETRPADKESDAYFVHTAITDDEENIIMMTVVVDPTWEPKIYEKLFYKLQEDIRHEIEHFTQMGPNRIPDRPTSRTDTANLKTVYGHHKNKIEVPALVHGFYRRAKLEKRPLDDIMIEDLDSEIERGNLSSKQAQKLLQIWVDYAKKNLPKAKYST